MYCWYLNIASKRQDSRYERLSMYTVHMLSMKWLFIVNVFISSRYDDI